MPVAHPNHVQFKNLTGQKFGRLSVIEYVGRRGHSTAWLCHCDCGKSCITLGPHLTCSHTQSCGCLSLEKNFARSYRHGEKRRGLGTRTYNSWCLMISRCTNPNNRKYKDYSGRGISVDPHWLVFKNFLADMGKAPPGMTIDRINNDGNYEKRNCRWATRVEQANNTRRNKWIEYGGKTQTISQWAAQLCMTRGTLDGRLKSGWSVERALLTPIKQQRQAS